MILFDWPNLGAELIAINKAKYYKTKDGLSLGPGSFVAGLEFATNKKVPIVENIEREGFQALVVGKPSETFFKLGLAALGADIRAEETVMIGSVLFYKTFKIYTEKHKVHFPIAIESLGRLGLSVPC